MKQGTLIYNPDTDRMDIRFGLDAYYGGLHCGQCLDVFDGRHWVPSRIEFSDRWYLVGVKTAGIEGLRVRIAGG